MFERIHVLQTSLITNTHDIHATPSDVSVINVKYEPFKSRDTQMKRILICFTATLLIVTNMPVAAESQTVSKKSSSAIRAVLDAQRNAWNKGDIEGFMDGYDRSDNTVFVSGDNVTRGWKTVLDRYKKNYDTHEKMGQLTFSDLEVNMLSKDTAVVIGKWLLKRSNDEPHGRFTLIFKKTGHGWRIIHDHTSSA